MSVLHYYDPPYALALATLAVAHDGVAGVLPSARGPADDMLAASLALRAGDHFGLLAHDDAPAAADRMTAARSTICAIV